MATKPLSCAYDYEHEGATCVWFVNTVYVMLVGGSIQAFVDLVCLVLPFFVLWSLKVNVWVKGK